MASLKLDWMIMECGLRWLASQDVTPPPRLWPQYAMRVTSSGVSRAVTQHAA
jgi:hypothetical protein